MGFSFSRDQIKQGRRVRLRRKAVMAGVAPRVFSLRSPPCRPVADRPVADRPVAGRPDPASGRLNKESLFVV